MSSAPVRLTLDAEQTRFGVWRFDAEAMDRAHTHADVEFNFLLTGRMRYLGEGGHWDLRAGRWVAFWAGIPHQLVEVAPGTDCRWITTPITWLLELGLPLEHIAGWLRGERWLGRMNDGSGLWRKEKLDQWIGDLKSGDPQFRRVVELELEATLRRLSLAQHRGSANIAKGEAASHVAKTLEWIVRNYAEDISVAEAAAEVGLHPNYLHDLFRRSCGLTIWEYVTRLRLSHAERLLIATDRTITDVAFASGFGHASAFYRAFEERHRGVSPGEWRKTARRRL